MSDKPTRKECMEAKCADCMSYWVDGKRDCHVSQCPLYQYQPYKEKTSVPDLEWKQYNPRRVGKVTWEESRIELSEEERQRRSEIAKQNLKANG